MDRRDFIKLSSIGLAGLSLPKLWAAAPKKDSMSDKIDQGTSALEQLLNKYKTK